MLNKVPFEYVAVSIISDVLVHLFDDLTHVSFEYNVLNVNVLYVHSNYARAYGMRLTGHSRIHTSECVL